MKYLPDYELLAVDSTTISCSVKLMAWALGKYSKGAVKMHTVMSLRGSIPVDIHITHGKWHDSNMLDAGQTHEKLKNQYDINICDGVVNRWSRLRIKKNTL